MLHGEGMGMGSEGYALGRLAKSRAAAATHPDPATRARAAARAERWERTLSAMGSGVVTVGSRTPVADLPTWATLEVVTGGFATGAAVSEGPLEPDEVALAQA